MDRTSPSVFSMGTRERSGALFQDPAQSWQYVIYVAGRTWKPPVPHRAGWNPVEGQERFNTPYKKCTKARERLFLGALCGIL